MPELGAIFWADEARSQLRDSPPTPDAPSRFPWPQAQMTYRHLQVRTFDSVSGLSPEIASHAVSDNEGE